jgi:hypothetical protein
MVSQGRAHPPLTTCRHRLPVESLWDPLAACVPCRAGLDAMHRDGRAPRRVAHWHRTCTLSDQHQGSPAGGIASHASRVPQSPGATDVRQTLETGQVVRVPDQGKTDCRKGGSPDVPDEA